MTEHDDRHGSQAGYSAHRRAGETPCADCKAARARTRSDTIKSGRRTPPPQKPKRRKRPTRPNYALAGYSPADGLGAGEWVLPNGRLGALIWVAETSAA